MLESLIFRDVARNKVVHLVLDALDESGDRARILQQLRYLSVQKPETPRKLKILVTSRSEVDIEHALRGFASIQMSPNEVDPDIALCIPGCVSIIARQHDIGNLVKLKAIEDALLQGINGFFIWIRMITDFLAQIPSIASVMHALAHIPDDLRRLYLVILGRLVENLPKQVRRKQMGIRLIKWLSCGLRPLSLEALGEALSIEAGDSDFGPDKIPSSMETLVKELCGPFVEKVSVQAHETVDQKPQSIVQFVHLSVKEFFLSQSETQIYRSPQDEKSSEFLVDLLRSHAELASLLLTYLSFHRYKTVLNPNQCHEGHHLLEYATTWWCSHLAASGQDGLSNMTMLREFSQSPQALNWLAQARHSNEASGGNLLAFQSQITEWIRLQVQEGSHWLEDFLIDVLRRVRDAIRTSYGERSLEYVDAT